MSGDCYIMVMRHNRFWLVGPFETRIAAGTWGRHPANNPEDDPRWQVIRLADPNAPVTLKSPHDGPM